MQTKSNTSVSPVKVAAQPVQPSNLSMVDWTAHMQKRIERTDSNPFKLDWLQEHGLGHLSPSEIFAAS